MDFRNLNWSDKTYDEFTKYLYTMQDIKYRDFHSKLLADNNNKLIGIRTPILRSIAKEISKGNYKDFIRLNKHNLYEENTINGLLIGYTKLSFTETIKYVDDFIPYINNWATCDLMCNNLKIFKKNLGEGFTYIKRLVNSNNPWSVRVALVLLLSYYMSDLYYEGIFDIISSISNENYYVKMACAWLISYCYINNPADTLAYLKGAKIDRFTYNKSLQKIIESYRVSDVDKETLKGLRNKISK